MASELFDGIKQQLSLIEDFEGKREFPLVQNYKTYITRLLEILGQFTAASLDHAMISQITHPPLKIWLEDLEEVLFRIQDVLDDWIAALGPEEQQQQQKQKKSFSARFVPLKITHGESSFRLNITNREIGTSIDPLCKTLKKHAEESQSITVPSTDVIFKHPLDADDMEVYGRDSDRKTIIEYLTEECGEAENGPRVISVVGAAGIGKTALTWLVLNDQKVKSHFDFIQTIHVADVPLGTSRSDIVSKLNIQELVKADKFLLVLDDMWTEDPKNWTALKEHLKDCTNKSRIVVTTRKEEVAKLVSSHNIYRVKELMQGDCWKVLRRAAFPGSTQNETSEFEEIGRKLVDKCEGVPLVVKALGSFLRGNHEIQEWKKCLDRSIWELDGVKQGLRDSLLLGYYDLPPAVKRCLLYCAAIPKGQLICKGDLIKLWMAQSYLPGDMESTGEEYFQRLASSSFFQNIERTDSNDIIRFRIHDMVYDIALYSCFGMIPGNSEQVDTYKRLHLMVKGNFEDISLSDLPIKMDVLRTVLLEVQVTSSTSLAFLLRGVKNRALKPGRNVPSNVLEELQKLKHLRYLDLSSNPIAEDIISNLCRLWNLQTLNLRDCNLDNLPREMKNLVNLRSIDLSENDFKDLPNPLYDLPALRALIVGNCSRLRKLPGDDIKNLVNLLLLDLSGNEQLEELPTAVCELAKLQTLNLRGCRLLTSLPDGIGKLSNLRQIDILDTSSLKYLPKGIAKLTSLRILTKFPVSDDSQDFMFEDLGKLKNLEGHLYIEGLENVANVSEVQKAELETKNMHCLHMSFGGLDDDNVIDVLAPNRVLEGLTIENYRGIAEFPSWIMSLYKLRKLELIGCSRCDRLPPLGELPSLVYLEIRGMESVKEIGDEFFGEDPASQDGRGIAFPKLEEFKISWMRNWEDWTGDEDNKLSVMPSLISLAIHWCPKLKAIPKFLSRVPLKNLRIKCSWNVQQRCQNGGKDWDIISRIPSIDIA